MKFSERQGFKLVRESIQTESMDSDLRTGLWNVLSVYCWQRVSLVDVGLRSQYLVTSKHNSKHWVLCMRLWTFFFKYPVDTLPDQWQAIYDKLREHFFSCEWFEVYDFVEFVAQNYEGNGFGKEFEEAANACLEREMSGYRFIEQLISPIISEEEVEQISSAAVDPREPVRLHLLRALELLSDRNHPDYRNSIKESISAVESLVALDVGRSGTLGELLKSMESDWHLHPALKKGFSALYGYASDEEGVRHALMEQENVDFHDAKLMLVLCSSFINYHQGKSNDA